MSDNNKRTNYPFFSDNESLLFFNSTKKNNWFCNKPLSPIAEEAKTSEPLKEYDVSCNSPLYDTDSDPEYIPETDISDDTETEETVNKDKDHISNHVHTSVYDFHENFQNMYESNSNSNDQGSKLLCGHKKILHNVVIRQRSDIDRTIEPTEGFVENVADSSINVVLNPVISTGIISNKKEKYKRKKDMCYFCELDVQNFPRHLQRNHSCEPEVLQIFLKGKKTKERRQLLALLKKKGNFIKNSEECVKPVKQAISPNQSFLPCSNCLGFYRSKFLYRHRKICLNTDHCKNSQAIGQNFLVKNIKKVDSRLKDEVFTRMRPDKISLVAKQDFLICAFGARYLKVHREKHFINVTSRKMRELARILMELKVIEPNVNNLFESLKPKYYDYFVEATKSVAKYDNNKDLFLCPTFALNICTSLKQCCDIALHMVAKAEASVESANYEASLKTMKNLLDSNWRFDISSRACSDLNIKKFNKITVVPLASDLKLLKEYLISKATEALKDLENNSHNVTAYNTLTETIFCRLILLNRRRPGELQRMLVHTYQNSERKTQAYEEFGEVVTEAEKILLKNLKRVVIRGKRGRGVPVMFSNDIQNHIRELFKFRKNFLDEGNPYLFGRPNSIAPICGYKIVAKYATACGAKNPDAITCTKLRKHLATLAQLFNLNDNEIEQLSNFMGHTSGVHKNSYRLPDDIYQTVKISKLLMLMEKGEAGEHKGKTLDDIKIDLDYNLLNVGESSDDDNEEIENKKEHFGAQNEVDKLIVLKKKQEVVISNERKGKRVLIPWTTQQKECVTTFFAEHIKSKKPPKKVECEELKALYPDILNNKNWLKIKVFIQNAYSKK